VNGICKNVTDHKQDAKGLLETKMKMQKDSESDNESNEEIHEKNDSEQWHGNRKETKRRWKEGKKIKHDEEHATSHPPSSPTEYAQ
jgi:hypothetical protein